MYVTDTTNVVLDINGYFAPAYEFHAGLLSSGAVSGGRHAQQHLIPQGLGPPSLTGREERDFPILNATHVQHSRQWGSRRIR